MKLDLNRNAREPLYQQIVTQIAELIRRGVLPPGTRLPPVRTLAAEAGLTRLTVHSAFTELQAQGLIESFVGRGTYVAERSAHVSTLGPNSTVERPESWTSPGMLAELLRMAERPGLLSFAQAFPAPETFPVQEFGDALRAALENPGNLGYGPMQGVASLREQISRLLLERGLTISPDQVLITSGAQQGIDLAFRAFAAPGRVVLVQEPIYPGALELAAQLGQRIVGVPADSHGIQMPALEAACESYRPRLLYLVPTFSNPTGESLAAYRRAAVLSLAQRHDMLIVEDDVYGLLGYDEPAPLPLKADDTDGRVLYTTSFSKILMPGLRLGAVVATTDHLPGLAAAKHSADLVSSPLLQQALAGYLRAGHIESHLDRVRVLYRERRDAMLAALQRFLPDSSWTCPQGGLNLWVALPAGVDERDFAMDAIDRGVGVARGRAFFVSPYRGAFMRLSFGMLEPSEIERGIALLGEVLRAQRHSGAELAARAGREAAPFV